MMEDNNTENPNMQDPTSNSNLEQNQEPKEKEKTFSPQEEIQKLLEKSLPFANPPLPSQEMYGDSESAETPIMFDENTPLSDRVDMYRQMEEQRDSRYIPDYAKPENSKLDTKKNREEARKNSDILDVVLKDPYFEKNHRASDGSVFNVGVYIGNALSREKDLVDKTGLYGEPYNIKQEFENVAADLWLSVMVANGESPMVNKDDAAFRSYVTSYRGMKDIEEGLTRLHMLELNQGLLTGNEPKLNSSGVAAEGDEYASASWYNDFVDSFQEKPGIKLREEEIKIPEVGPNASAPYGVANKLFEYLQWSEEGIPINLEESEVIRNNPEQVYADVASYLGIYTPHETPAFSQYVRTVEGQDDLKTGLQLYYWAKKYDGLENIPKYILKKHRLPVNDFWMAGFRNPAYGGFLTDEEYESASKPKKILYNMFIAAREGGRRLAGIVPGVAEIVGETTAEGEPIKSPPGVAPIGELGGVVIPLVVAGKASHSFLSKFGLFQAPGLSQAAKLMISGAIADAATLGEENMSTWLQESFENPVADNFVTEALAYNPNDPLVINKLRDAAEGVGLGLGIAGAAWGIKMMGSKGGRKMIEPLGQEALDAYDDVARHAPGTPMYDAQKRLFDENTRLRELDKKKSELPPADEGATASEMLERLDKVEAVEKEINEQLLKINQIELEIQELKLKEGRPSLEEATENIEKSVEDTLDEGRPEPLRPEPLEPLAERQRKARAKIEPRIQELEGKESLSALEVEELTNLRQQLSKLNKEQVAPAAATRKDFYPEEDIQAGDPRGVFGTLVREFRDAVVKYSRRGKSAVDDNRADLKLMNAYNKLRQHLSSDEVLRFPRIVNEALQQLETKMLELPDPEQLAEEVEKIVEGLGTDNKFVLNEVRNALAELTSGKSIYDLRVDEKQFADVVPRRDRLGLMRFKTYTDAEIDAMSDDQVAEVLMQMKRSGAISGPDIHAKFRGRTDRLLKEGNTDEVILEVSRNVFGTQRGHSNRLGRWVDNLTGVRISNFLSTTHYITRNLAETAINRLWMAGEKFVGGGLQRFFGDWYALRPGRGELASPKYKEAVKRRKERVKKELKNRRKALPSWGERFKYNISGGQPDQVTGFWSGLKSFFFGRGRKSMVDPDYAQVGEDTRGLFSQQKYNPELKHDPSTISRLMAEAESVENKFLRNIAKGLVWAIEFIPRNIHYPIEDLMRGGMKLDRVFDNVAGGIDGRIFGKLHPNSGGVDIAGDVSEGVFGEIYGLLLDHVLLSPEKRTAQVFDELLDNVNRVLEDAKLEGRRLEAPDLELIIKEAEEEAANYSRTVSVLQDPIHGKKTITWVYGNPIAHAVAAFPRAMFNVANMIFVERTPLGFLSPEVRKALSGERGAKKQQEAMGAMFAGTALVAAGGFLSHKKGKDDKGFVITEKYGTPMVGWRFKKDDPLFDDMVLDSIAVYVDANRDLVDREIERWKKENSIDPEVYVDPIEFIYSLHDEATEGEIFIDTWRLGIPGALLSLGAAVYQAGSALGDYISEDEMLGVSDSPSEKETLEQATAFIIEQTPVTAMLDFVDNLERLSEGGGFLLPQSYFSDVLSVGRGIYRGQTALVEPRPSVAREEEFWRKELEKTPFAFLGLVDSAVRRDWLGRAVTPEVTMGYGGLLPVEIKVESDIVNTQMDWVGMDKQPPRPNGVPYLKNIETHKFRLEENLTKEEKRILDDLNITEARTSYEAFLMMRGNANVRALGSQSLTRFLSGYFTSEKYNDNKKIIQAYREALSATEKDAVGFTEQELLVLRTNAEAAEALIRRDVNRAVSLANKHAIEMLDIVSPLYTDKVGRSLKEVTNNYHDTLRRAKEVSEIDRGKSALEMLEGGNK